MPCGIFQRLLQTAQSTLPQAEQVVVQGRERNEIGFGELLPLHRGAHCLFALLGAESTAGEPRL